MFERHRELQWLYPLPITTVSLFANTRTRRRTAFTVLLFWLFAIASSFANACLIQPGQTHLIGSAESGAQGAQAPRVSPGHRGADAEHPENAGVAKSACLKFCGDREQAIVKLTPGIDLLDLPVAPPLAIAWTKHLVAAAPASALQAYPALRPGLPLRIRFSRLTL